MKEEWPNNAGEKGFTYEVATRIQCEAAELMGHDISPRPKDDLAGREDRENNEDTTKEDDETEAK